jgi:hypothetical protein
VARVLQRKGPHMVAREAGVLSALIPIGNGNLDLPSDVLIKYVCFLLFLPFCLSEWQTGVKPSAMT